MHATPTNYETQLRAQAQEIVEQGWLNFLYPFPPGLLTLRPHQVQKALHFKSVRSVYDEINRLGTWLEVSRSVGTQRSEMHITARSVILHLVRMAMEGGMIRVKDGRPQPPLFLERCLSLADAMSRPQLEAMKARCEARLKGLRN